MGFDEISNCPAAWLEMSRNPDERLNTWGLGECLVSPQKKADGFKSGYWELMKAVQPGDIVFHLTGVGAGARFSATSIAASSCETTGDVPYGINNTYRVELEQYVELPTQKLLSQVFEERHQALFEYFQENKKRPLAQKELLFYVYQSRRLQCQNGAYLTPLSTRLVEILFEMQIRASQTQYEVATSAATGTAYAQIARRVGQRGFSNNVKANFGHRCCFPGCEVNDSRFLIGAHIARWADNIKLRGDTSNGLCLCVLHDKAFEIGAFTLSSRHEIVLPADGRNRGWLENALLLAGGKPIKTSNILPSLEALNVHWIMHGYQR